MLQFVVLLLIIGLLFLVVRALHLNSPASPAALYLKDSSFNKKILQACSLLTESYIPPLLWGKSGHIQTMIYGKMGRINSPFPRGRRHRMIMPDGATATFDVFEPEKAHPSAGDFTLLMCPGIANSSESLYICTCVHYAQSKGYRVAVLNHLGALAAVPLTSPRIFTYGDTEEYASMVDHVQHLYPDTRSIAVGFSMGGNVVLKYLGESKENQKKVMCAITCCAAYDAEEVRHHLMGWEHLRRVYMYVMTRHIAGLLNNNRDILFGEQAVKQYGQCFDEFQILAATSMVDIDELYTRRRGGFSTLAEYYHWCSCAHYIHSIPCMQATRIDIPVFLLNTLDDPLVPPEVLHVPKNFALTKENVIFATTQHGGHLGYFEGSLLYPDTLTWLDKIVIQYCDAAVSQLAPGNMKAKIANRPIPELALGKQQVDYTNPSSTAIDEQAPNSSQATARAALHTRQHGKAALCVMPSEIHMG